MPGNRLACVLRYYMAMNLMRQRFHETLLSIDKLIRSHLAVIMHTSINYSLTQQQKSLLSMRNQLLYSISTVTHGEYLAL